MAIKKIRMRPEGTNDYADVLHPETSGSQVIFEDGSTVESHKADKVHQKEVHGMRLNADKKLEYHNGTEWVEVKGGGYPVNIVKNVTAEMGDESVSLMWEDPDDVIIDGVTVAKWKQTKVMRKVGSYPTHEEDGELVVSSGVRNQYKDAPYTDTGLINNTEYFYSMYPVTEDEVVTLSELSRVSMTPMGAQVYGVVINENNSNPETSVTYTNDAVGFSPMRGNNGNFQWGSWKKIFDDLKIRPCLLKNGVVNYYLNPDDYSKKSDGSLADITSGNDGDVMIEFPKIYWQMEKIGTNQYVKWSTTHVDGFKCLAHTVGSDEVDFIYVSAYNLSSVSGRYSSLSESTPMINSNISTFRSRAGRDNGCKLMSYYIYLMLQVLYVVFFKSLRSTTALGNGKNVSAQSLLSSGACDKKGMFYGATSTSDRVKFCGIEDVWGNINIFVDGIVHSNVGGLLASNQDVFNNTGEGYVQILPPGTIIKESGIKSVQGTTNTGFIIKSGGGSISTYYTDYGSLDLAMLGASSLGWTGKGMFGFELTNSATTYSTLVGCRAVHFGI